jgi:hypothetical protein
MIKIYNIDILFNYYIYYFNFKFYKKLDIFEWEYVFVMRIIIYFIVSSSWRS